MTDLAQPTQALDVEEQRRLRTERLERVGRWVLPMAIMVLAVWFWDRICVWNEIPQYILPRPGVVLETLRNDATLLFGSLLVTLKITFFSLALAVAGGVGLAVLFTQSKWVEMSFFPFAVILQVTDCRDFPAHQYLCRQSDDQIAALRLDRRFLSYPVEYDTGAEFCR